MGGTYIFESERLGFRLWKDSDKARFAKMNADKDVMAFMPKSLTPKESNNFILKIEDHFTDKNYGLWAVDVKSTGSFIGFIGFYTAKFDSDFTPCVEIGWRINKVHWNKGYATEGARACLEYGFNNLGFDKIYSFTSKINVRSIRVMEKIGLIYEKDFDHPNLEADNPLRPHVLYITSK